MVALDFALRFGQLNNSPRETIRERIALAGTLDAFYADLGALIDAYGE